MKPGTNWLQKETHETPKQNAIPSKPATMSVPSCSHLHLLSTISAFQSEDSVLLLGYTCPDMTINHAITGLWSRDQHVRVGD